MSEAKRPPHKEDVFFCPEILAHIPAGLSLVSTDDYSIVYANSKLEKMFGYDPGEIIGQNVSILNAPTNKTPQEKVTEILAELADGKEWCGEINNIKKDGTLFWCKANVSFFDHSHYGKVFLSIHTDITGRKKAEQEFTEADNFNQLIINTSPVGLLVFKESGPCVLSNRAAEIIVGASSEEMLKLNFREMETYKKTGIFADLEEALRTGAVIKKEICTTNTFGKEVWFEGVISTFQRGGENHVLYLFNDIMERKKAEVVLQKSEERHRTILQTAMDGIWLVDDKGRFLEVNDSYCQMSGYSEQELLSMNISDVDILETPEETVARIRQILKDGRALFVSQHRRKDGTVFDVEVSTQYRSDDGGQFVVFIRDITEQLLAERALKAEEEKYRLLFQNQPSGFALHEIILDAEGHPCDYRFIEINQAFEKLTGLSASDLVGKTVLETMPETEAYWIETYGQIALTGQPIIFENYSAALGKYYQVNAYSPELGKFATSFHDITARKMVEEENKNLADRLLLATASAKLGVWDWNVRENTMLWDDRMFELYGVTRAETPNNIDVWLNGLHSDDKEAAMAVCQCALNGEADFDTEFRVLHPDGTVKHLKANGLVIQGEDGKPERMLGINLDITEQKQAVEAKIQLENQLQQAQKVESIGQLAGGIAHDFNNMLGVILGHTELALMKADPSTSFIKDLEAIRAAAKCSGDLTQQLLAFARKQSIAPKVLDLNDTVAGMLKILQRLIGENIHLSWNPEPNLWAVKLDPSQLDQILANLCVNARDAIAGIGKITIGTQNCSITESGQNSRPYAQVGDYVRLSVSDDGHGIDKENLKLVFEPFFTTKEIGQGTGLGLAMVFGAVKQNLGFIDVISEPDEGTTFHIYLPRQQSSVESVEETTAKVLRQGTGTVLLVEDDQMLLQLAKTMLEDSGYRVLDALTIDQAISLAKGHPDPIHLLLSDLIMPEMNGKDLRDILQDIRPEMKVIFMSGYTADIIAKHGVIEEGAHFLQKPFSYETLASKVLEVLESD